MDVMGGQFCCEFGMQSKTIKKAVPNVLHHHGTAKNKSGRQDLNLRPHDPQSCTLAKLSYAP